MESNGAANRIHISEATADASTARCKGAGMTPRKDEVDTKGKCIMQTYFVNVTLVDPSHTSVDTESVGSSSAGSATDEALYNTETMKEMNDFSV